MEGACLISLRLCLVLMLLAPGRREPHLPCEIRDPVNTYGHGSVHIDGHGSMKVRTYGTGN
jgi:hypothetical protein